MTPFSNDVQLGVYTEVRKPLSESGKTNEQEAEHQNSTASFPSNQVAEQPTNNAKKACSRVDLKQKTQISETFQVKAEDNAVKPLMKNVPLDTTTQHGIYATHLAFTHTTARPNA